MSRDRNWARSARRMSARGSATAIALTLALAAAEGSAQARVPRGAPARVIELHDHSVAGSSWRARLTTGARLRMGAHLVGGFGLRVSLRDSFTSLEPGAPPSAPVGVNPSGFAVNEATHTVYVVNDGDNTVSVIDSQACDARNLAGGVGIRWRRSVWVRGSPARARRCCPRTAGRFMWILRCGQLGRGDRRRGL